ncbi:MAG: hypothetical protein ACYC1E_00615 [Propionibacteriaceae bacterium]
MAKNLGDIRKVVVSRQPLTFTWRSLELLAGRAQTARPPGGGRKGRKLFDEGEVPYHFTLVASEVFPTGVLRVLYAG